MGAINYGTSDYVTVGLKPYDRSDFEDDPGFIQEIEEEVATYGGTIEEAIDHYISDCYDADYSNISTLLESTHFQYFSVTLKSGYYEGFYLSIENNYPVCHDSWQDKREALKEATQIKRFLLECLGCGLRVVYPGWVDHWFSMEESKKKIAEAIRAMKQEIKETPTWMRLEAMEAKA